MFATIESHGTVVLSCEVFHDSYCCALPSISRIVGEAEVCVEYFVVGDEYALWLDIFVPDFLLVLKAKSRSKTAEDWPESLVLPHHITSPGNLVGYAHERPVKVLQCLLDAKYLSATHIYTKDLNQHCLNTTLKSKH